MFGPIQGCDPMYVAANFRSCADTVGLYGVLDVKFEISHGVKLKKSNNALIQGFQLQQPQQHWLWCLSKSYVQIGSVYFSFSNSTL